MAERFVYYLLWRRVSDFIHRNGKKGVTDDLMTSYRLAPQLWPELRDDLQTSFRQIQHVL